MPGPNEETILLKVDIQANNARLVELQKQLNDNRVALLALNQAAKEGRITNEELAAGQVTLATKTKQATTEIAILTKANGEQKKSTEASKGSINQLRAELALATAAYNALSESERDGTKAGQDLQANVKSLSDQLKKLESAVGDNRRNVGNYAGSLKDAIKESGFLGAVTDKVAEAQKAFAGALNITRAGIGGNVTALGFLRFALLATGLGAVVVVLGSLVSFLTQSQAGIDLVSRKFAGLKAVVDLVIASASEFGGTLVAALSSPKQAIADLIAFIETNLLNRVKAIGIIFQALADRDFMKVNDGLIQLTVGITNASGKFDQFAAAAKAAAKAGEAVALSSQQIRDQERALNVERSRSREQIKQLNLLGEDTSKAASVRAAAIRQAGDIEIGLNNKLLALQRAKIANLKAEQALSNNLTADNDKLAEEQQKLADVSAESLELRTTLQNKLNTINQAAVAAAETGRKDKDDAMLKSIEADIAAGASREEAAAKFQAAEDAARVAALAREEKDRADKLTADTAAYARDLAMLERNLDDRRLALESANADGLLGKEEYEGRLTVIDAGGYAARLLLAKQHNQDISAADKAQTRFHNAEVGKQTEEERREYASRVEIAKAFGADVGATLAQTLTDSGASLQDFAGKFLILILDLLEKQVLAGQVGILVNSLSTKGLFGVVEAAALTATVTAAFAVAKAAISAQNSPQKFATGGVVPGSGNGDTVPALLTPGEVVMNKASSQAYAPLLSFLNASYGGASFAGSPTNRQTDGGLAARNAGASLFPSAAEIGAAVAANVPDSISVRDINQAQRRSARVRSLTSLG